MTAFVIDASVALAWYLADERSKPGEAALLALADGGPAAPGLWWLEVRNVLIMSERRGRIDEATTKDILDNLAKLNVHLDHQANSDDLFALARAHRLTAYDAAYLELAKRLERPLATLDKALARAARAERVPLLGAD